MPTPRPDPPSDVDAQIAWVNFLAWFRELSTVDQARFVMHCRCEIDEYEVAQRLGVTDELGTRRWRVVDAEQGMFVIG